MKKQRIKEIAKIETEYGLKPLPEFLGRKINELIDAHEALRNDVEEHLAYEHKHSIETLEKKYEQHIKAEHIGYDPKPLKPSQGKELREKLLKLLDKDNVIHCWDGWAKIDLADKIMELLK